MKKNTYILFTSGRGPVECGLAVQDVQMRFKKFLEAQDINFEIVSQQMGRHQRTIDTIVFRIEIDGPSVNQWLGTIQWICKSPIRKYSKRKNWFIKCCEVIMPDTKSIDLKDIIVQAFKSSGPGGQHRNKVETAVRIIHNLSGIIVTASDSKSKAQNKKSALAKLKEKLSQENTQAQKNFNLDKWSSKIEIQRGNPSKVFYGEKFTEV